MRGKSWTVEEEKQLRELIGEGLGTNRISKVMGKTPVSVMNKTYHLGLALIDDGTAPLPPASSSASPSTPPLQTVNQAPNNALSVSPTMLMPACALPFNTTCFQSMSNPRRHIWHIRNFIQKVGRVFVGRVGSVWLKISRMMYWNSLLSIEEEWV